MLWKGTDSDPADTSPQLIGKVIRIHENRLVKEVKKKLGFGLLTIRLQKFGQFFNQHALL